MDENRRAPAFAPPFDWVLRKWFWTNFLALRHAFSKPQVIRAPPPNRKKIGLLPYREKWSAIPLDIVAYDSIPKDENKLNLVYTWLHSFLNGIFGAMRPGLPEIDPDINVALDYALTDEYLKRFKKPVLPAIFDGEGKPELEDLIVQSPFSVLLEKDSDGNLVWDFRDLGKYEHHPGLCSLAVHVIFKESPELASISAAEIWSEEYGTVCRGEDKWLESKRLAICAANTHLSLTRHFNYIHLVTGNHWDVTVRNHLPTDHPLYRLLWPFIWDSIHGIHAVFRVQMNPDGDYENMFSYTHAGLMKYFDDYYKKYRIEVMDPELHWKQRGLEGTCFKCPTQENLLDLFNIMHAHAKRYVYNYYNSDKQLKEDTHVTAWLTELEALIPNGLGAFRLETMTRDSLARLLGGYIYEGNTSHDLVGTALWDYQLWADRSPTRIYKNGRRIPIDVFQRIINNNFALQVVRAPMLADYGDVALDEQGAAIFTQLYEDAQALQERYDQVPAGPWRMEPKNLEISMNS